MKKILLIFLIITTISLKLAAQDQVDSVVALITLTSKNQNLYAGIDNYLVLKKDSKVLSSLKYNLSTNNGIIKDADSCFLIVPKFTGLATLKIYRITPVNDSIFVKNEEFKVLNLPIPSLRIGECAIGSHNYIDRKVFLAGDSLRIFFSDDIISSNTWCKVTSFNFGYQYGNNYISVDNNSPIFSEETIRFLKKINSGQEVVIKVNNISTSQLIKNLPLIRFTLK
jgi:hypothetical protein